MQIHKHLPEEGFIQMGDFVGVALRHSSSVGMERVNIVGMIGKISKMANGQMMTHAAGSEVNLDLLAGLAGELGADESLRDRIRRANTAREVLEICSANGLTDITTLICKKAVEHGARHAGGKLAVHAYLVDFDGKLLGQYPLPENNEERP